MRGPGVQFPPAAPSLPDEDPAFRNFWPGCRAMTTATTHRVVAGHGRMIHVDEAGWLIWDGTRVTIRGSAAEGVALHEAWVGRCLEQRAVLCRSADAAEGPISVDVD